MATNVKPNELQEEQEYSELVIKKLVEVIDEETGILASNREKVLDDRAYFIDYFREMHKDEREDWLQMEHANVKQYDVTKSSLERYGKMLASPYFGKVVFKDEKTGREGNYYIGLYGLKRDFTNYIVDWRAPVSGLYYESEPGPCSYQVPAGERKGELTQKRRFAFEDGVLDKVQNIKLPSDDDFLNEMLAANSSDYLKVIVSTLQADQNKIIRDFVDGVHVIAGCAGSGKSSVAMHKIAYIMFSFREQLKNSNIVVLSPNMAFAGYISHVLPDLGEENVKTITQEEMIEELTRGSGIDFCTRDVSTERMLTDPNTDVIEAVKFKNSELFKKIVYKYAEWFSKHCFNAKDLYFSLGDTEVIDEHVRGTDLATMFYNQLDEVPVADRIVKILDFICRKNHVVDDEIRNDMLSQLEEMMDPLDMGVIYKDMFKNREFFDSLDADVKSELDGSLEKYYVEPLMWEDRVAVAALMLEFYGIDDDLNVF